MSVFYFSAISGVFVVVVLFFVCLFLSLILVALNIAL